MLIGFEYRIYQTNEATTSKNSVYSTYYPQFKKIYSKYDIRNIFSMWKGFIYLTLVHGIAGNYDDYCDIYYVSESEALHFISKFNKKITNNASNPILFNKSIKDLTKPTIIKV